MPGKLTTHVLDVYSGKPAAGMRVDWRRECAAPGAPPGPEPAAGTLLTDADGRTGPVLEGGALLPGRYEFRFHAGEYFRSMGSSLPDPPFLDIIPVCFGIADADTSWHVPLLVSPWAYSTYRGS